MPRGPKRPFPRHSLSEALRVAQAIKEAANCRPIPPVLLAKAMRVGASSSEFRDLLSSSERYGLTSGGPRDPYVSLLPRGQAIVSPTGPDEKLSAIRSAILEIEFFRGLLMEYNGGRLPDDEFLANVAERKFGVPPQYAREGIELLKANAALADVLEVVGNSTYVVLEKTPTVSGEVKTEEEPPVAPRGVADVVALEVTGEAPIGSTTRAASTGTAKIFIGHGRNKQPLADLKAILDEFGLPYLVAEEEPNRGRPISQKVADVMRSCRSAILIFTKDEHFVTEDGRDVWRPSENVVHELGAASVLYGNKIVIFREEGLDLPSNFRDIGYISFAADGLKAKAMELLKELIAFGLVQVIPG